MSYAVFFSPSAEIGAMSIRKYIAKEFGTKAVNAWLKRLESLCARLETNPFSCPATTKHSNVRRCLIFPSTFVTYRIQADQVYLLSVYDARSLGTAE